MGDDGQNQDDGTDRAETSLDIAASPERVWVALTTPDGLAPWMGDGAAIDLRPGGTAILPDPVGGSTRRGRVDRIDPGQRLDLTWWPALRPADRTTVSITVTPIDTGTRGPAASTSPISTATVATAMMPWPHMVE